MKSVIFGLSMIAVAHGQCNGINSGYLTYAADTCQVLGSTSVYYNCTSEEAVTYNATDCSGTSVSANLSSAATSYTCDGSDCDTVTFERFAGYGLVALELELVVGNCGGSDSLGYYTLDCCDSEADLCFEVYTDDDCSTVSSDSTGVSLGDSDLAGTNNSVSYDVPTDCDSDSAWKVNMGMASVLVVATALLR